MFPSVLERLEGAVELAGEDLVTMRWGRLRAVRWTEAAIVFQGAMHSLNPVRPVGKQIAEALELHRTPGAGDDAARAARVRELLGLPEHVQFAGLVALGLRAEEGFAHHRHEVDRVATFY